MNTRKCKVILKTSMEDLSYDVEIFINEENKELSYVEKDNDKTFVSYNYMNNVLKRDNNSLCMEYDFNNEIGYIYVKDLNKKFDVDLKLKNIKINSKKFYIEYYMNDELYKFELLSNE